MKQTTKRLSSTILAILLLVAALVVFFDVVEPEYGAVQALRSQEEGEQVLLASQVQLAQEIQSIVTTYQSQSAQAQEVGLAMPIGENNADALAQIYGLAAQSGLTIQNVSISPQGSQGSILNASVGGIVKPMNKLSFQLSAMGSYGSLKAFLQGLENNIRIFDVAGIGIAPVNSINGPSAITTQDLFNYTLTVFAYYQSS